jgi:integrase
MRSPRMIYAFGVDAKLVTTNPARKLKAPAQIRSKNILPFETWAEVERVAAECGRWGPMVLFMADTGARPAEAARLEHRHVDGNVVELPDSKTEHAWRTVHMTDRGVDAIQSMPRAIQTRNVFHIDGRQISWVYFWREVWRPALELAKLPLPAAVQPSAHVRVLVAPRGRADRDRRPRDGAHQHRADVPSLRRLVPRDGSRRRRDAHRVGRTR